MKMNKHQRKYLAGLTCNILEVHDKTEVIMKSHGIPKKLIKKFGKALDIIWEINAKCVNKAKS